MSVHGGSCGCGKIQFRVNIEITRVVNCNCHICRNSNGAAFSTYAIIPASAFEVLNGKEYLKTFLARPSLQKHFCSACGTPIYNENEGLENVCMVHYGVLFDCLDLVPTMNVYCDNKLAGFAGLEFERPLSEVEDEFSEYGVLIPNL